MIFDSKRRQAREAEADTATLAEAPRAAGSFASEDLRTVPPAGARPADRDAYAEDEPAIRRPAMDDPADNRLPEGAVEPRADRPIAQDGIGRDKRDEASRNDLDSLEPLFPAEVAQEFRRGWDAVQIGFVDDPRQAVQKADELVHQVLHNLTEAFTSDRSRMEVQGAQAVAGSTEDLRMALRRYRAFLHRLLAL